MSNEKKVIVDGVEYVPKICKARELDGMRAVIVRTYSAGVFYGYLESQVGGEVVLKKSTQDVAVVWCKFE